MSPGPVQNGLCAFRTPLRFHPCDPSGDGEQDFADLSRCFGPGSLIGDHFDTVDLQRVHEIQDGRGTFPRQSVQCPDRSDRGPFPNCGRCTMIGNDIRYLRCLCSTGRICSSRLSAGGIDLGALLAPQQGRCCVQQRSAQVESGALFPTVF